MATSSTKSAAISSSRWRSQSRIGPVRASRSVDRLLIGGDDPNRHIGAALGKTRFGPCKKRTAWSIAGRRLDVSRVFSKFSFLPLHDTRIAWQAKLIEVHLPVALLPPVHLL